MMLGLLKAAGADVLFELAVDEFGDGVGHNAPYFEAVAEEADVGGLVVGVVGDKPVSGAALFEALDGELAVDGGHHNVAGLGLEGAVNGHEGAVGNVRGGTVHAVAADPGQVGAVGVGEQNLVEVDFGPHVVLGRAGETSGNGSFALQQPQRLADDLQDFDVGHETGTHDFRQWGCK